MELRKIVELRKVIERENLLFDEISRSLSEAIRQFGAWRNDWQAEQQRWNEWQPILLEFLRGVDNTNLDPIDDDRDHNI